MAVYAAEHAWYVVDQHYCSVLHSGTYRKKVLRHKQLQVAIIMHQDPLM